jgi:hypothetical protein
MGGNASEKVPDFIERTSDNEQRRKPRYTDEVFTGKRDTRIAAQFCQSGMQIRHFK